MTDYEYLNVRRIVYGEGATFVPVCAQCFRFVKADPTVQVSERDGLVPGPNADCSQCGRTEMLFEGFI